MGKIKDAPADAEAVRQLVAVQRRKRRLRHVSYLLLGPALGYVALGCWWDWRAVPALLAIPAVASGASVFLLGVYRSARPEIFDATEIIRLLTRSWILRSGFGAFLLLASLGYFVLWAVIEDLPARDHAGITVAIGVAGASYLVVSDLIEGRAAGRPAARGTSDG